MVVGGKTVAIRGAGRWMGGEGSAADVGEEATATIEANGGVVEHGVVEYDTDAEEGSSDGGGSDGEVTL